MLLVVAAAHSVAWWWAVRQIEAGLPGFMAGAEAAGWRLASKPPSRAGWPLAATIAFPEVTATRPFGATALQARVERLEVTLSPMDVGALLIRPLGAQSLTFGAAPPLAVTSGRTTLRIPLDGGPATFTGHAVSLAAPGGTALTVAASRAQITAGSIDGSLDGMTLAPPLAPPFNGEGRFALRATMSPPASPAPTPAESARLWQAAGGSVDIAALSLQWGPLVADGSGRGGLDPSLQPAARGELTVQGAAEVLEALAQARLLDPSGAGAARAVLRVLALSSGAPQGGLRLPVTLERSVLSVARFPLLRLPRFPD